ncbi:MAG: DUF167 domain-containing protein [Thermoplasmata archaeon]|nr:DUF167 domain-containing protein [Thermoplasmata archaeon]
MKPNYLEETEKGVSLRVAVVPNSSENRIAGYDAWRRCIKVHVVAPASRDRANRCLVNFLAEFFEVPCGNIEIVAGNRAREKIVAIAGLTKKVVEERIKNAGSEKT